MCSPMRNQGRFCKGSGERGCLSWSTPVPAQAARRGADSNDCAPCEWVVKWRDCKREVGVSPVNAGKWKVN